MWTWLLQNKEWVFSGVGVTVIVSVFWLFKWFMTRKFVQTSITSANQVTQNPTIREATAKIPANKIDDISFDYLPDSPLNHGGVIAYPQGLEATGRWKSAKWSLALDAPIRGSLHMEVDSGSAIAQRLSYGGLARSERLIAAGRVGTIASEILG